MAYDEAKEGEGDGKDTKLNHVDHLQVSSKRPAYVYFSVQCLKKMVGGQIFWEENKRVSICETVEKRVISGHNQMSPTDQGSSSLTRLPLHPQVIAAKLFNCPKLPSNDVNCRGHQ